MKTISTALIFPLAFSAMLMSACAGQNSSSGDSSSPEVNDPNSKTGNENEVIKARVVIEVEPGAEDQEVEGQVNQLVSFASGKVPIDVINAPNTTIKFDTSKFKIPAITNAVLNFGTLGISALTDNTLNVCGKDGKTKCKKAFVRLFTTGTKGAGIWNAEGNYGMPISAVVSNKANVIGLEVENAIYVVNVNIPDTKNVMYLADLLPTARYGITSDFKNAGAGSYSTTLIIEYGLAD